MAIRHYKKLRGQKIAQMNQDPFNTALDPRLFISSWWYINKWEVCCRNWCPNWYTSKGWYPKEGYLGVDISKEGGQIILRQEGFTKRIISALGLDSKFSTPVDTPAESMALGKDLEGKNASGSINYTSVIGSCYIWVTVGLIYLLQCTSVCSILIPQNNLMKMP